MHQFIYLKTIYNLLQREGIVSYLVGGAVRDLILGRKITDIDIVVKERVADLARYFAEKIKGSFVVLDEAREIYRVVGKDIFIDFTRIKGKDIVEDLEKRDFTINAMALPLYDPEQEDILARIYSWRDLRNEINRSGKTPIQLLREYLIDPENGIIDLKNKKIKVSNKLVFKEDPLRLWRAFRFSAELEFRIDEESRNLIHEFSVMSGKAARERIKEELMKILKTDNTVGIIEDMENYKLLSSIIPEIADMKATGENKYHREDAWTHSLQVLKVLEEILEDSHYRGLIGKENISLVKLSALLHDIGKLKTRSIKEGKVHYFGHESKGAELLGPILKNLKFSRREISFVTGLVRFHMRPMLLYLADNLTEKGILRFFQQGASLTPIILIHSLADKIANMRENERQDEIPSYVSFVNKLMGNYVEFQERTKELYLSGKEIIALTGLKEGPAIGELLNKLVIAQANGKVNNREEAIRYIKNTGD